MALERLSLAPAPINGGTDTVANGVDGRILSFDGADDGNKTPRLPRWTRQEILVLIQGKKVAESRVRRGRAAGLAFGSSQVEPKWASVSSYCKRHGVNREAVQCRKRWSNLSGDYKKIKEWESQIREETESFWVMRNDLRRERKLPGFFDKEVYDILDAGESGDEPAAPSLALALPAIEAAKVDEGIGEEVEAEVEVVFDSGRSAAADDGLFSDEEAEKEPSLAKELPTSTPIPSPIPISEKMYQPFVSACSGQGRPNEKQPTSNPMAGSTSQEGRKRKRFTTDGDEDGETTISLEDQLIQVLERNGKMLNAQLEAQNTNIQLDREQRKDHADNLVSVLNKLADALGRIAEKL